MPEDRLKRDYDIVENLDDLIEAREERGSASADDIDALEDIDEEGLPADAVGQLTWPHPRTRAEENGRLGINVDLMGTPDKKEVGFDWQDSVEEMLPTDPQPSEGMGADAEIEALAHVDPADLAGPIPSIEVSPETGTAATEDEQEEYGLDGGEEEEKVCPPPVPVQIESAMETDSDEEDFRIVDRFQGEADHETAHEELEEMRELIEEVEREGG